MSACGCEENNCTDQPCGCKYEVDAGCVRYTGEDLSCIDVATGDVLSAVLAKINNTLCELSAGTYVVVTAEVAGANCAGGGVRVDVKDINTDAIISTDYVCGVDASALLGGSGTLNYLARWTPDGDTLGIGATRDNGDTVSIGDAPDAGISLWIPSTKDYALAAENQKTTGTVWGIYGGSTGAGTTSGIGVYGEAKGATALTIGSKGVAVGGTVAVGGFFTASSGSSNYALRLQDGTQGSGKFLKSIDVNGNANWATIAAADVSGVVGGSGTLNYLARWTPDGATLGIGIVRDNGNSVGINASPDIAFRLYVEGSALNGANFTTTKSATNSDTAFGISGESSGVSALGKNIGVYGVASRNTNINYGVHGAAQSVGAGKNVGVYGLANNSTTANYAAQLIDGSEGVGKVLTCMTATGEANWVTPSGGVSGSGTVDYLTKWTPSGTALGNSQVFDDGSNISVNGAIFLSTKFLIRSDKVFGLSVQQTVQGIAGQYYSTVSGATSNTGIQGRASGSTTANTAGDFLATGTGADIAVGGYFGATAGASNYSLKLQDNTQGAGKFLKCVDASGHANWATLPTIGGLTWTTLSGTNPRATLAANNGYLIKNTTGAFTSVTLPSSGVVVGDIIKIIATDGGGGSLSTWRILEGRAADVIIYSFHDITTGSELAGVKNTSPLLTFDNGVAGSYIMFKNQSLTLTCVEDLGTGYAWNIELANGKVIS